MPLLSWPKTPPILRLVILSPFRFINNTVYEVHSPWRTHFFHSSPAPFFHTIKHLIFHVFLAPLLPLPSTSPAYPRNATRAIADTRSPITPAPQPYNAPYDINIIALYHLCKGPSYQSRQHQPWIAPTCISMDISMTMDSFRSPESQMSFDIRIHG